MSDDASCAYSLASLSFYLHLTNEITSSLKHSNHHINHLNADKRDNQASQTIN